MTTESEPLTRGNAIYVANRLGVEHASSNRYVFNLLIGNLLGAYVSQIAVSPENERLVLPKVSEIVAAAQEGYSTVGNAQSHKRLNLGLAIDSRFKSAFAEAIPQLRDIQMATGEFLEADTAQEVVRQLVAFRRDAARRLERESSGVIDRVMLDRRTKALLTDYLNDVPVRTLFFSLALPASHMVQAVAEREEDAIDTDALIEARRLTTLARAIPDGSLTEQDRTWILGIETRIDIMLGFQNPAAHPAAAQSPSP